MATPLGTVMGRIRGVPTCWLPTLEEDTSVAPAETNQEFKEYKYSASSLTEFSAFQLKIVMKATNSAHAPRVKDLRGLALAV